MVSERENVRSCPSCSKPTRLIGMRGGRKTFYCDSCGAILIVPVRRQANEKEEKGQAVKCFSFVRNYLFYCYNSIYGYSYVEKLCVGSVVTQASRQPQQIREWSWAADLTQTKLNFRTSSAGIVAIRYCSSLCININIKIPLNPRRKEMLCQKT